MNPYSSTADALVQRILALPHDKVEACNDAWGLFKIEEFKCDDLEPSLFQADWALSKAKFLIKEGGSR